MARRHAVISAAPTKPKYTPAFTVQKLDGMYEQTVARMTPITGPDGEVLKGKNGNAKHRLEYEKVSKPTGWLITFPKPNPQALPHSIHVATMEEMIEEGYTRTEVPLVDEDGEAVGSVPNVVRKQTKGVDNHA